MKSSIPDLPVPERGPLCEDCKSVRLDWISTNQMSRKHRFKCPQCQFAPSPMSPKLLEAYLRREGTSEDKSAGG